METVIVKAFVWMCSPHTYKHCVFRNASPVCKSRSLIRPLNPAWICSYTCRPLTEPWPERTLQSPPGGQWALFSIPLLLPLPVFISLHLFWSSGVISQIKCLSAHKGRWLICFNTSICQPSCLSLHGVCERRAPRLNWHFKTYKHFNTSGRRGLQCVSVCVCVRAFVCVCESKYIPPRGLGSQPPGRYITPDIINVQLGGERKWNVALPANMLRPVSRLQSD